MEKEAEEEPVYMNALETGAFWPDEEEFKNMLISESKFRVDIVGDWTTPFVKQESKWRYNLYKNWLKFLDEGFAIGDEDFIGYEQEVGTNSMGYYNGNTDNIDSNRNSYDDSFISSSLSQSTPFNNGKNIDSDYEDETRAVGPEYRWKGGLLSSEQVQQQQQQQQQQPQKTRSSSRANGNNISKSSRSSSSSSSSSRNDNDVVIDPRIAQYDAWLASQMQSGVWQDVEEAEQNERRRLSSGVAGDLSLPSNEDNKKDERSRNDRARFDDWFEEDNNNSKINNNNNNSNNNDNIYDEQYEKRRLSSQSKEQYMTMNKNLNGYKESDNGRSRSASGIRSGSGSSGRRVIKDRQSTGANDLKDTFEEDFDTDDY